MAYTAPLLWARRRTALRSLIISLMTTVSAYVLSGAACSTASENATAGAGAVGDASGGSSVVSDASVEADTGSETTVEKPREVEDASPDVDGAGDACNDEYLKPSNLPSSICACAASSDLFIGASESVEIDTGDDGNCDLVVEASPIDICVIKRRSVHIGPGARLSAIGTRALAIVGTTRVDVEGTIDVSAHYERNGPGAPDSRGTYNVRCLAAGAPGGGYGTAGGRPQGCFGDPAECWGFAPDGGSEYYPVGGASYGTPEATPLVGGAAGGGLGRPGGGGGGALQLVSCGTIEIGSSGRVVSGGGGGLGGVGTWHCLHSGGGGGSGGTILVEAASVTVAAGAAILANGGGGGSGGGFGNQLGEIDGNPGANGSESAGPAPGGAGTLGGVTTRGAPGGNGGADGVPPQSYGDLTGGPYGAGRGGAGGAVGRVRINTVGGTSLVTDGGIFSPMFTSGSPAGELN